MPDVAESVEVDPSPDMESSINDFFSTPAPSTPEPSTPSASPSASPADAAPAAPAEEEAAPSDAALTEEGEPAEGDEPSTPAAPRPAPGIAEEEGFQSEDGHTFQLPRVQLDTLITNNRYAAEVQQFAPTVEDARELYSRATDLRDMYTEFTNPDALNPATGQPNIDHFIDYWKQESPQGLAAMASRIPDTLKQLDPQSYSRLETSLVQSRIESMYTQAMQLDPSTEQGKEALLRAQNADYAFNGKFRSPEQIPKPDPLAEQRQQLDARQREFDQRVQQSRDAYWGNTNQNIQTAKQREFDKVVDEVLAPVKEKFASHPDLYNGIRLQVAGKVRESIRNDAIWNRNHDIDHGNIKNGVYTMLKTGKNDATAVRDLNTFINSYVQEYANRARMFAARAAGPVINQATSAVVAANNSQHAKLAASQRRAPAGGGRPAPQSISPKLPANATMDDKIDAFYGSRGRR